MPRVPQYWQVYLSRRKISRLFNITRGRGRFIILPKRMMDGLSISFEMVLMVPRPSITILALPVRINPIALRVVQILMGAKLAFKTRTGSYMVNALLLFQRRSLRSDLDIVICMIRAELARISISKSHCSIMDFELRKFFTRKFFAL
jgi:hypothetical protein